MQCEIRLSSHRFKGLLQHMNDNSKTPFNKDKKLKRLQDWQGERQKNAKNKKPPTKKPPKQPGKVDDLEVRKALVSLHRRVKVAVKKGRIHSTVPIVIKVTAVAPEDLMASVTSVVHIGAIIITRIGEKNLIPKVSLETGRFFLPKTHFC